MKTKNIFAAGLMATMALVACNKVSTTTENGDGALKSVTINLANLVTKSSDEPKSVGQVTLNEFQVFFADATGKFYQAHAVDDAAAPVSTYINLKVTDPNEDEDNNNLTATFHFLDPSVTTVYVFGNCGKLENADDPTTLKYANLDAVKAEVNLTKIEEQDAKKFDNLKLYGESGLTLATSAGTHGPNYYDANVNLAPLVSRIEIVSLEYAETADADVPRKYNSITFEQFSLNNWYKTAELTSLNVAEKKVGTLSELYSKDITDANVWNYLDGLNETEVWYNDITDYDLAVNVDNAELSYKNTKPDLAYHFFPGEQFPQIIARFKAKDGEIAYPFYLKTTGFNEGDAAITETDKVGKIYKVAFTFSDSDINNPLKCVNLTVDVIDWVVVNVTPNFN